VRTEKLSPGRHSRITEVAAIVGQHSPNFCQFVRMLVPIEFLKEKKKNGCHSAK